MRIDISSEPLGNDKEGHPVYLRDIWPSTQEIADAVTQVNTAMFHKEYAEVFAGDEQWQAIEVPQAATYVWNNDSTYIQHPPFFDDIGGPAPVVKDVEGAKVLALLGDSVTTDHISPAGNIKADSPAGHYLREQGVEPRDFNSYGSRRGNHQVMMRGTFANIRIRNEMLGGEEGGNTIYIPTGEKLPIYDAAMRYQASGTPLVVIAGQEYGTGSSRDWAAKGTNLLGGQSRDRGKLRADSPFQSGGHGRVAVAVQAGSEPQEPEPHRQGNPGHPWPDGRRTDSADEPDAGRHP